MPGVVKARLLGLVAAAACAGGGLWGGESREEPPPADTQVAVTTGSETFFSCANQPADGRKAGDAAGDDGDDEAGDRALLAELKQLRTEWQEEAVFDDDQLTPPGLGDDSDLDEDHEADFQKVVDQLFEIGLQTEAAGGSGGRRIRELYDEARKWTAEDPRLPWLTSLVLARRGEPERARALLAKAGELLEPMPSTLRLQQASLELELGNEEAVWKNCREVIAQWPKSADHWPGDEARGTQAVWLGQLLGYIAGGEQPSTFRLDEFRRLVSQRWPAELVEDYDRALHRMRDSRQAARLRSRASSENRQAEARQSLQALRDLIASSRTTEEQLRRKLANLESPYKEKWDQVILTLKQKLQRLTAAQAQARRQAARLRQLSRAKPTKANRARRSQVRKQLKKALDQVRGLQRQMAAGKAQRKELEAKHADQIHPVKHELNRVRLARQANEKESERVAEQLQAAPGTAPPPENFRPWRLISEADLLRDLRAHWND
jgi:hypothetical protein